MAAHAGLIVEEAAKVITVWEDIGLMWQIRATGFDEVDAWESVLLRDFLGAEMLFDCYWVVGAALHTLVGSDENGGEN